LEHTAADGKNYKIRFYNLDVVISVGYRVNSRQATLFRIWATERLKEYIIKAFAESEYQNHRIILDHLFESDSDQMVKTYKQTKAEESSSRPNIPVNCDKCGNISAA